MKPFQKPFLKYVQRGSWLCVGWVGVFVSGLSPSLPAHQNTPPFLTSMKSTKVIKAGTAVVSTAAAQGRDRTFISPS